MMAEQTEIVKVVSEQIARDLIKRRGTNISDTTIAIEVADTVEDLTRLDADVFINLIRSYIKVADVHVSVPTWRVADDGTLKTERELEEELKF
jgi:hypothetical protein